MTAIHRRYHALLEVSNVLNSQREMDSLWQTCAECIKEVVSWERAGVLLYTPEEDGFRFHALETNMPKLVLQRGTVIPRTGSAVGWVYDHREVHVRPHLQQQQVFLEDRYYAEEGLGRMVNLPLLARGNCLGTLNIGSVDSGELDAEMLEFLRQVAIQVALAIENVQAYEQLARLSQQLAKQNAYLTEEIKQDRNFGLLVGKSEGLSKVLAQIQAVAATPTTVLIMGETGTGKELVARAIHERSPRCNKPFIRLNCAALPSGLVESELFGHERGAFTGAVQRHQGRFELAHEGTLFLDEIGEMPLEIQAKLLRVLEDNQVDRVGGAKSVPVDVRFIAATNVDLAQAVADGRFRADLYYRLTVFPIVLPPLRDRSEDIPLLAQHFLQLCRVKLNRGHVVFDDMALERLTQYDWPGNIRELQNVIERATILAPTHLVAIDERVVVPSWRQASAAVPSSPVQDSARHHIHQTLEQAGWRIYGPLGAANRLGINPSTLRSRMKKLGLSRPTSLAPLEDPHPS
ncbi:MAG: Formate hydrogenlyase transcriptional activator [Nitrospira sp.]|nr:MAG: Formate hydrogenlyase transcriptional activator [Nitrospira sp.]